MAIVLLPGSRVVCPLDANASQTGVPQNSFSWFVIWTALLYFFDLIVCLCAAFIIEWIRKSKAQALLEQQKAEAELKALKHQVNPHFLFNSLSFIYNKTALLDEQAAKSVLILSDIMRYNLSSGEDATGRVPLEKEIEHLENIIEMHQARHDNKLQIVFNAEVINPGVAIVPLVMIILVENAFKHGALFDRDQPVQINLRADRKTLRFSVLNKKEKGRKELSTGIGLRNMRQRLALMYGERSKITIDDNEQTFFVSLQIPLEL
jgi:two-component system LytT family sensor kinase